LCERAPQVSVECVLVNEFSLYLPSCFAATPKLTRKSRSHLVLSHCDVFERKLLIVDDLQISD